MSTKGWIGVDLDGTLAHYDGWKGADHIGEPVPLMLARVKEWLAEGKTVKIFTARVWHDGTVERATEAEKARIHIVNWMVINIGMPLEITCMKDYGMVELWDDRAVQVIPNTGVSLAEELEAERSAQRGAP